MMGKDCRGGCLILPLRRWGATISFLLLCVTSITEVLAFSGPTRRFVSWRRSHVNSNGGCGGDPPRPPIGPFHVGPNSSDDDDDDSDAGMLKSGLLLQAAVLFSSSEQREGSVSNSSEEPCGLLVRGGDASASTQVVRQPKLGVLHKLKAWWGALTSPLRGKRQGEQELQRLKSVNVDRVTAPNSTVLPPEIVREASQNLIGNPLTRELVQDVAVRLKDWYLRNGYVLNSITGATLVEDASDDNDPNPSTQAEAQLVTQEPVVTSSQPPVRITFCKPMVYDSASGQHMAPQDYTKLMQRSGNVSPQTRANITYVETKGRTNPKVIARILGIKPGEPFCWSKEKWDAIVQSGLFSSILQASPATVLQKGSSGDTEEVGVQLNIACVERPPCRLEYGMAKNLYSGAWEGEVDLLHTNLLGAGQSLDLSIRKGGDARRNSAASPYWMPSVHLQYKDSKFGLGGGYEVDLFHDDLWVASSSTPSDPGETSSTIENNDPLVTRQGGTFRWQNLPYCSPQAGGASVSLEQTLTKGGKLEQMGSTRAEIGPFYSEKGIPLLGGRSSITSTVMLGSQYKNNAVSSDDTSSDSSDNKQRWLPYTLGSVMMRQSFPFKILGKKEVTLALQHSASTSTKFLPRHECNALGLAARIRGYPARSNGVLSSSIVGTTELRVPISLPSQLSSQSPSNDATLVLFSDYAFMERSHSNKRFLKSSIGVGLRKSLMNVPVKVDFCITKDGKPGAFVGVGHDFDV